MTDTEKRIKIAEKCGWTDIQKGPYDGAPFGRNKTHQLELVFDYLNDLNAMHSAEEVLKLPNGCMPSDWYLALAETSQFNCERATARQRADAFLRTIGEQP